MDGDNLVLVVGSHADDGAATDDFDALKAGQDAGNGAHLSRSSAGRSPAKRRPSVQSTVRILPSRCKSSTLDNRSGRRGWRARQRHRRCMPSLPRAHTLWLGRARPTSPCFETQAMHNALPSSSVPSRASEDPCSSGPRLPGAAWRDRQKDVHPARRRLQRCRPSSPRRL
jgi:hypothetical protein